jgi:membrane protein implicated in regulation of membrane protease activity
MNWAVGKLVTHSSYNYAFVVMAGLHPLALVLLWRLRRPRDQKSVGERDFS